MRMKVAVLSAIFCNSIFFNPAAASDEQLLINAFHEYGITKCDSFILENSKLKSNWNLFINKQAGGMDGPATEVTITHIFGSKGDTVKNEDTYIQTAKNCYYRGTWTVTFPGSCSESVDGNLWYVSTQMPNKDYTTYKNAGGVELHTKEISMGNFKACVQEGSLRKSARHG
ncbi:hypothetical protein KP803_21790 [Vibrio sp. ZSDE26]|uniref:Uncharacterized protein n=1 Tax=Vibrio amylolyticus TaxID=2847292 RepID=A0A9X1XMY6_9VIBR|nr:hypothetical protein [Vibrio amylolyticus]MCK6265892.1 hypothetical protein [Vibrio amylolyticus]